MTKKIITLLIGLLTLPIGLAQAGKEEMERAVFAGGCFWCMEYPFEKLNGVLSVTSGYTGGEKPNPTYEDVSHGDSGHLEAVEVVYNPDKISFRELLDVFWRQIDPTDDGGQFMDRGHQYRTAIFYFTDDQRQIAEKSKKELQETKKFEKPIVTTIESAKSFYPAEDYHQNFHAKNPVRYNTYRSLSGREKFLCKVWETDEKNETKMNKKSIDKENKFSKPSKEELKEKLTPLQFKVTQQEGTEPPFKNEFWNNKKEGIYIDVVSGEPLFSSTDKYESGTGWPSFIRPIDPENIVEKEDRSLFSVRTEVRSKDADSHLGHVFNDGPAPTGQRYCINSAALRFIPKEDMEKEGYGDLLYLFE